MPELIAGKPVTLGPRVTRVLAPNPGFMTGAGTNSYLIGHQDIAVLDPGPADPGHVEALLAAAARLGGKIRWIVLTHTHQDHAPAALLLQQRTGAPILGQPPLPGDPAQATLHVDEGPAAAPQAITDEERAHRVAVLKNLFVRRKERIGGEQSRRFRLARGDFTANGETVQRNVDPERAAEREIAQREGIRLVVDGDVTPLAGGSVLSVRLVAAASGDEMTSYRESVTGAKDLIPALDRIIRALRAEIGEERASVNASPPLERVTTPSLAAAAMTLFSTEVIVWEPRIGSWAATGMTISS